MAAVNWDKIKKEYLTTDTNYRALAEKYGVNRGTLQKRATREKWAENRGDIIKKVQKKKVSKMKQNVVSRLVSEQSDTISRDADMVIGLIAASDELVAVVQDMLRGEYDGSLKARDLSALSATLRNVKEIRELKSALDEEEQRARIAELKRQTEDESKREPLTVELLGWAEDATK